MYIVSIKNDNQTFEIHNESEKLKNGKVVNGINAIDSFSFTLLPSNKGFNRIRDYKTLVTVYNTNKNRYEFYGRVLYSHTSMEESGLITKEVTCESYFGFLCDSKQKYVAERNWTVSELLSHIINVHNSQVESYKHFAVGEVDNSLDANDNIYIGIQRDNSWKVIEEKLLKTLGGEIRFRVVDDVTYIDYLKELGETRATKIKLSRNMKAITRECDPSSFISRLIPLGCKLKDEDGNETEERIDIKSVNSGLDYIEDIDAKEAYGIRVEYVEFDDVTTASNLLAKGKAYLAENNRVQVKYTIKALDLSLLGLDIDDFDVCNRHPIENALLGINDIARINKKNIDVCNDKESTIDVGDNFKTLSDLQIEQAQQQQQALQSIETIKTTTNATKTQVENLKKQYEGLEGSFIHIRYSEYEDGHAMTEEPTDYSLYIGICSTMDDKAPTDHTEYTWSRIGTDNTKLEEIKEVIVEQNTTILNDCESIILQALESYVETNNYEEFKETISSQLQLLADEMTLTFTTTTEQITEVNGDFQSKWNRLLKHIEFSGDTAISISSDGTAITLELDNEKGIVFKKNGVQFGWWDGVDFHTGNIIVDLNERAQFGNFAFVPRSDGSLSFLKVGG